MAMGGDQGERPRHWKVGQICEYNVGSVTGRIHPGGNGMDYYGMHTEGWMMLHSYRASRGHMEGLHVNR